MTVTRTAQDILAERRSVVQECRRERDETAREILQYQINELDRELHRLQVADGTYDRMRAEDAAADLEERRRYGWSERQQSEEDKDEDR